MPNPLPDPPADYSILASRFPRVPKEQLPDVVYRVHQKAHEPEWFGTAGGMRWDPPPAAAGLFGVCYTATDPLTAFVESVADLHWLRTNVVSERALATLQTVGEQRLADLTNPKVVGEWGLDRRICTGDDYEVCGKWAYAFRLAGFTGIFYEARHDLRVGPFRSVAVFGDPGRQPAQITLVDDGPLPAWVQESARRDFGIQVASVTDDPARRPALVEPGQDASPVREQAVYRGPKSLSPTAASSPSKEARLSYRQRSDLGQGQGPERS